MKNIILSFTLFGLVIMNASAQHATPYVDSKGHIHYNNVQIGSLTAKTSLDNKGIIMTQVDRSGNIVDTTGKIIGKAPKNSSFEFYASGKEEIFRIGPPSHTGVCTVTNSKGETVLLLHQNYKAQAACVIHCLYENHCMPMNEGHSQ